MANLKTLTVQERSGLGKGANRRLRKQNSIPGIFYTSAGINVPVEIPLLPLSKLFQEVGHTTVFNLEIEGAEKTTHPVLIWKKQSHPVKNRFTHVDFYGVTFDKPVKLTVPLVFTGVAQGTKVGGKMEIYREAVYLMAKPLDMPSKITIDVSTLGLGDSIHIEDLKLPDGVKTIHDFNYPIVSVILPNKNAAADSEQNSGTAGAPGA